jgi:hypothetical protein
VLDDELGVAVDAGVDPVHVGRGLHEGEDVEYEDHDHSDSDEIVTVALGGGLRLVTDCLLALTTKEGGFIRAIGEKGDVECGAELSGHRCLQKASGKGLHERTFMLCVERVPTLTQKSTDDGLIYRFLGLNKKPVAMRI